MNEKLENLIIEIGTMIESGTIMVGGFGISQDSANFVREYGEKADVAIGSSVSLHSDLTERAELLEKIEEMKLPNNELNYKHKRDFLGKYDNGYNRALDDIKKLLT